MLWCVKSFTVGCTPFQGWTCSIPQYWFFWWRLSHRSESKWIISSFVRISMGLKNVCCSWSIWLLQPYIGESVQVWVACEWGVFRKQIFQAWLSSALSTVRAQATRFQQHNWRYQVCSKCVLVFKIKHVPSLIITTESSSTSPGNITDMEHPERHSLQCSFKALLYSNDQYRISPLHGCTCYSEGMPDTPYLPSLNKHKATSGVSLLVPGQICLALGV